MLLRHRVAHNCVLTVVPEVKLLPFGLRHGAGCEAYHRAMLLFMHPLHCCYVHVQEGRPVCLPSLPLVPVKGNEVPAQILLDLRPSARFIIKQEHCVLQMHHVSRFKDAPYSHCRGVSASSTDRLFARTKLSQAAQFCSLHVQSTNAKHIKHLLLLAETAVSLLVRCLLSNQDNEISLSSLY